MSRARAARAIAATSRHARVHTVGTALVAHLKAGRERSLVQRHPWIFSGAIDRVDGNPASGATIDIVDAAGAFVARAAYSPQSQIRARVWSFDPEQTIDTAFFAERIERACAA